MQRNRRGRPRHPDILTPAEWRVLDALRDGGTNAEIAARLGLSQDTVKTHVSNMLAKLELRDRRALAAWRPEERRGRLGGVLAVPAVLWAVVGRPLVWVGMGTVAVAGAVVAVVAAAGVVVAVVLLASGDSDASPFATPAVVATAQGEPGPGVSCSSGVAVTNPETNTELVGDCEALLGLRDTIRGTGTLNWTAGKAISEWTGVTVSGTPQRVTAMNLSDFGLDGELSGLLGNLTGLTTLDLSGNALTGMLPSKLALLTNLTNVSIAGTDFEGCAPPGLGDVVLSDVATTGLDDCDPPPDMPRSGVIRSGTYQYADEFTATTLVLDVPDGVSLVYRGLVLGTRMWLYFEDDATGAGLLIALEEENTGGPTASLEWLELTDDRKDALDRMFNQVVDSVWFD